MKRKGDLSSIVFPRYDWLISSGTIYCHSVVFLIMNQPHHRFLLVTSLAVMLRKMGPKGLDPKNKSFIPNNVGETGA
jgi:hypothetical protein